MKIYSIYDRATEAYQAPFFQPTGPAAIRIVKGEANREGSMLNAAPADFELWELGDFNETTGEITAKRERIARITDLKGAE